MYYVLDFANFCKNKHGILIEFINSITIRKERKK